MASAKFRCQAMCFVFPEKKSIKNDLQAFTKYIETFQNLPKIKTIRGLLWTPAPNFNVALYVNLFGLMPVHMTTAKCTFYAINIEIGGRWRFVHMTTAKCYQH